MDAAEQVSKFAEFVELNYKLELSENIRKGEDYLYVDFLLLSKFDPDLASLLLEDPEDVLKAYEIAVMQFSFSRQPVNFSVRVFNLPESNIIPIASIRSQHITKFIAIEGVIRQKSDVRPRAHSSRFECPSCGNIIPILQLGSTYKEPTGCGCGRKGKFRLMSEKLEDMQSLVVEESIEMSEGDKSKKITVVLTNDLVARKLEKKYIPGSKVLITGIVNLIPVVNKAGVKQTRYDQVLKANYIKQKEEMFEELKINEDDVKKIKQVAKKNPFELMQDAVAPNVYGRQNIKRALVLQCFGGVKKPRQNDSPLRGDSHILLLGDAGSAKSMLLRRMKLVWPKATMANGTTASGVGLTAAVVRDEFGSGFALEAGAIPLANKGLCCVDEFEKIDPSNVNDILEAMEQQTISVNKANIQEVLPAETTLLCAGNPEKGRFDNFEEPTKQTKISPPVLSRFDLIYFIRDIPDEQQDSMTAKFILEKHQQALVTQKEDDSNPFSDIKFFRKYIAYARLNCRPVLSKEAFDKIHKFYTDLRAQSKFNQQEKYSSLPITARQLEALVRLSEASAKSSLSQNVTVKDAEFAIEVYTECMNGIALDPKTGQVNIDNIEGLSIKGITPLARNRIPQFRDLIRVMCDSSPHGLAPIEDLIMKAVEMGIGSKYEIEDLIVKGKQTVDWFEPRSGYLQLC